MPRLPATLRPGFIIRRKAMHQGIFGSSTLWKLVAAVVFGRGIMKKVFGRQPEVLARSTLGAGHILAVATSRPLSRREQRKSGINRKLLESLARAELDAGTRVA